MYKCFDTKEQVKTYDEYLKTKHWKNLKARIYKLYKYKCANCGSNKHLNLHHKTYDYVGKERIKDLVYLCENCHKAVHEGKIYDKNFKLEKKVKNKRSKKPKKKSNKKKKFVRKPKCSSVTTYKMSDKELKEYKETGKLPK